MISLFDQNTDLVAWLDNGARHLFDTDMNWLAYVSGGHLWSAATGNWLGPLRVQRFSTKRGDLSGGILGTALLLRRGQLDRPVPPVLHALQGLLVLLAPPGQLDRRHLREAGQQ